MNVLTPQSEEIRSAVEDDEDLGAGDQGIMVGFASDETDSKLPKTFDYSRQIQKELWDLQHASAQLILTQSTGYYRRRCSKSCCFYSASKRY